ncbi:MAG: hypothetical protein QOJ20_3817 [Mycobacterium sp.]|jgi:hypothetical protein|nr:hypothetical protein [Mycobacterium sp.]
MHGLGRLKDLVGQLDQLDVLPVFLLDHLPLEIRGGLPLKSARFWLIITNVDRKD